MKALVFHRTKDIRCDDAADPRIENARDVILRVTSTSICGSDLHIYNGYFSQKKPMILGHEFMGVVEEVGPRVTTLRRGDRVVVPFPISCGACYFCLKELPGHCERTNTRHYGPDGTKNRGGGLFGYTDEYGPYNGGQAQFVRVPYADVGPRKIPGDGSPDERYLFLSDIIPTGWTAARWCDLKGGETVAVFGCGPVGLMAMKSARLMGAERVIGLDIVAYRRELAKKVCGAEVVNPDAVDPIEAIREMTAGRGADACIDAVGLEADHGVLETMSNVLQRQVGHVKCLKNAVASARRGGIVSMIGAYGSPADFPINEIFEKGLTLRGGQAPVHAVIDELLQKVSRGQITAEDIVTHRMRLEEGPRAYKLFNDKADGCVKIVLKPWPQAETVRADAARAALSEVQTIGETLSGAEPAM